ncbi:MAG: MFS transporter [Conchiformibius sp.]|nr:MFS transporter [Conchiformibius sp.]
MTAATSSRPAGGYTDRRAVTMLLLGFAAGLPILLIFSTLSLWLSEAGVERKAITLFSFAALGYSFKFVWAPLIDVLPVPLLSRLLGRRRGWLLTAQLMIMAAVLLMASVNPGESLQALWWMAAGAVLLGFSSATQDVVIDAYRIEAAPEDSGLQAVMSSTYVTGYRIGMIVAGAGSLWLAAKLGSAKDSYVYEAWRNTYWLMAGIFALCAALTVLWVREPEAGNGRNVRFGAVDNLRLLLMFVISLLLFIAVFMQVGALLPESKDPLLAFGFEVLRLVAALAAAVCGGYLCVLLGVARREVVWETWVEPLWNFFQRYGKKAFWLLALIGLYRISDIVAGVVSNLFYADMGFSKEDIAFAVKTLGVLMVIAGGFVGGVLAQRFAVMKMMMLGAVLAAATNLLFVLLAWRGHDTVLMYLAVGVDNLAAGLASTVFVAFLSSLTNVRFTAVQYALFSSLMTLLPKVLGGYSGAIVEHIGYAQFFMLTAALGVPILFLVWRVERELQD